MASITDVGGVHMSRRLDMTTAAQAVDLGVIHPVRRHRYPGRGEFVMAGITDIAGADMSGGLTTGRGAVMAHKAVTHEGRMVRRATAE